MRLSTLALTPEEIQEILTFLDTSSVLVGGQALALWAELYRVNIPGSLSQGISADVDFIGSVTAAKILGEKLNAQGHSDTGMRWTLYRVEPDDATPQTAKLAMTLPGLGIKEIDFLGSIVGLDTKDIRADAVEVTLKNGKMIKVLHPLDVLRSRLHNLARIASRRNEQGYAQVNLALRVVRAFLQQRSAEASRRELLDHVKEIREIALDKHLARVYYECGFDVLSCVPLEQIRDDNFHKIRWPQIVAEIRAVRAKEAKRQSRYSRWPGCMNPCDNKENNSTRVGKPPDSEKNV